MKENRFYIASKIPYAMFQKPFVYLNPFLSNDANKTTQKAKE